MTDPTTLHAWMPTRRTRPRNQPSGILRPMRLPSLGRRRDSAAGRPPAPFVVGANRSGTTLLRLMLDAHPELTIPPETHFLPRVIRACRHGASPERVAHVAARHRRWDDFGIEREQYLDRLRQIDPLEAGAGDPGLFQRFPGRAREARGG